MPPGFLTDEHKALMSAFAKFWKASKESRPSSMMALARSVPVLSAPRPITSLRYVRIAAIAAMISFGDQLQSLRGLLVVVI